MEYTELIWDRYLDSFDSELAQLWDLIGSNLLKAAPSARVAVLKKTVVDFSYSSRFMLMRLLQARAGSDGGFEYVGEGILCSFTDISADHASSMSAEESEAYERVLADIALRYEQDAEYSRHLITKAWHTPESYEKKLEKTAGAAKAKRLAEEMYRTRLTRQEAFDLGHVLGFTLNEMQQFLLRVFDTGECMRFTRSEDIIEAYAFLTGADLETAERLKTEYGKRSAGIKKDLSVRTEGWTALAPAVLGSGAAEWMHHPDDRDERFMAWLLKNAPHLDIPSRSAQTLYRNLLAFVCRFSDDTYMGEDSSDLSQLMKLIDDEPSEQARELIPDDRMLLDKKFSDTLLGTVVECRNRYLGSFAVSANKNMELSSADATKDFKEHVYNILLGRDEVEKSDMLYLLWIASGLCWCFEAADENLTFEHLCDFQRVCEEFLRAANLPELYYPHIMETSIFLSIVSSTAEYDPSETYAMLCEEIKNPRKAPKPNRKHSEKEQLAIVRDWIARKKTISLGDFAAEYEVSPKSVSLWQKRFRDKGML